MTKAIPYLALAILAVLGVLGNSAGMVVSVGAMALAFWYLRKGSVMKRLALSSMAGLVASLLSEAVHTLYHYLGFTLGVGTDSGWFFMSATVVPLMNAVAFGAVVLLTEFASRRWGAGSL